MLAIILILYLAAALTTLHSWLAAGFVITGDAPHYLVITRGILIDHTLEQTVPYREAFEQGLFLGSGITEPPSPANTHAYLGPHGLFNIHNFGLPLLLVVPYALQGVLGVQVFLILVGGIGIVVFWKISGVFTPMRWVRALSVAAVGLAMPLLSSSSQIFPDIPAGVLCLVGLYWLITVQKHRSLWREVLMGLAVGYLPLLQIKFAAPAAVLAVALALAIARRRPNATRARRWRSTAVIVVPFVSLLGLVFAFNLYAFSNLTGPYEAGAFRLAPVTLMVFVGLAIDQNQGFLFQSPLAFLGLVGVGMMLAWRRNVTIAGVLVFFSLIVPNVLLSNQYGGYSFIGRFQYPAALVFGVATLFVLSRIAERSRVLFAAVCAAGIAVQALFWAFYTFSPPFLESAARLFYNPNADPGLLNYSVFFYPLQNALAALYNDQWAFGYLPNYVWAAVVVVLLAAGVLLGIRRHILKRVWMPVAAVLAAGVLGAALISVSPTVTRVYDTSGLIVEQGTPTADGVSVSAATGQTAGPVTAGPITLMRAGTYTVSLTYSSTAPPTTLVGTWQPAPADADALPERPLAGTNGEPVTVSQTVVLTNAVPRLLQLRTTWNGVGQLTVLNATYVVPSR
ncbi:hypothetical protein B7R25_02590 [Subtercola boreus]|uniref:Glycosyltransferase RgtA/B/C/D-like domain-containing protein n=1 Tax=Subtercola boreus TaxID=120213 RepID=A0A3E0WDU8_9MICO|nr:hypothetical protein B7R24_02580 [Subtercola boreus]RFA22885.1 hypothetical protein B7R23_02575 [Subtercola boreus]RFA28637.1 hypothetical protein B7R25_02590 [Subtercola boreus]